MISPTPLSISNSATAADVLKLLKALSQVPVPAPARPNIAVAPSLIGLGPLAAIKDPTADSVMSIIQLGQNQSEAENLASAEPENTANEAATRTYVQVVEQEYASNNAEILEQAQNGVSAEADKVAVPGSHENTNNEAASTMTNLVPNAERSLPQQAGLMSDPLLFLQTAAYLQQALSKAQAASKKRRASWRFILQKKEDLAE